MWIKIMVICLCLAAISLIVGAGLGAAIGIPEMTLAGAWGLGVFGGTGMIMLFIGFAYAVIADCI
jgi:hypothetical protein